MIPPSASVFIVELISLIRAVSRIAGMWPALDERVRIVGCAFQVVPRVVLRGEWSQYHREDEEKGWA